jgi:micrococcal nuclease
MGRSTPRRAAILLVLLAGASPLAARATSSWRGKVVAVATADTLEIERGTARTRVRVQLYGIATPEPDQPFTVQASRFTAKLVLGKVVTVITVRPIGAKDPDGGTVARVHFKRTKTTRSLSEALLRAGLAWWDLRRARTDKKLAALEAKARKARRGLWAKASPVAPWTWRAAQRSSKKPLGTLRGTRIGESRGTAAVDVSSRPTLDQTCYRACIQREYRKLHFSQRSVTRRYLRSKCRRPCLRWSGPSTKPARQRKPRQRTR